MKIVGFSTKEGLRFGVARNGGGLPLDVGNTRSDLSACRKHGQRVLLSLAAIGSSFLAAFRQILSNFHDRIHVLNRSPSRVRLCVGAWLR